MLEFATKPDEYLQKAIKSSLANKFNKIWWKNQLLMSAYFYFVAFEQNIKIFG